MTWRNYRRTGSGVWQPAVPIGSLRHDVRRDRVFIPLQAHSRYIRYVQPTVPNVIGLLQYRISPALPFEPMGGLGHPHHVGSNFRIQMR